MTKSTSSLTRLFDLKLLRKHTSNLAIYIVLFVVLLVAGVLSPDFFQVNNILNVLRQASMLGIVSVGQLFVIIGGGIDLSVSSVMTTATMIAADITRGEDTNLWVAIIICLLMGMIVALINIFLITRRNVPPFVATLGTYILLDGARLLYTKGVPQGAPPPALRFVGSGTVGSIPTALMVAIVIAAIGSIVLRWSKFGRRLYATGSNQETAHLSGVPTERVIALSYIVCSLLAVIAGLVLGGYIGYSDRYLGRGFDLDSISAVVVGGASFAGGVGTVEATIAGILIITVLSNILLILNLNVQLQLVLKGAVIIAAVAFYSLSGSD